MSAVLLMLAVSSVPVSVAEESFEGIGSLEGGESQVHGISADGEVVVGSSQRGGHARAVRWTRNDGMSALGDLAEGVSIALAASGDGRVVVGKAFNGSVDEAFRWTEEGGLVALGTLSEEGSSALDVSGDGNLVVGFSGLEGRGCSVNTFTGVDTCPEQIGNEQAFVWDPLNGMAPLGSLGDTAFSRAHAVSADGATIAGRSFDYDSFGRAIAPGVFSILVFRVGPAVQWGAGGVAELAPTPSEAIDVTSDGEVLLDSNGQLLIGVPGSFRNLPAGVLPSAVADDGLTLVGIGTSFGTAAVNRNQLIHVKPLLMQHFGLDLTGWVLEEVSAVSADGLTIAGNGINPLGAREGWLARIDAWPDAEELADVPLMNASSVSPLVSAVLPASRSAVVGEVVTVFVTMINSEFQFPGIGCRIGLASDIPAVLDYHRTDPVTNATVGQQNVPAFLAPRGGSQTFVIGLTPTAPFDPTEVALSFDCANSIPAKRITGVNTLTLSASNNPVPDVIALVTATDLQIPAEGAAAVGVAVANVGAAAEVTATLDTGVEELPVELLVCQTEPSTGECIVPPGPEVTLSLPAGGTASFRVDVRANDFLANDPSVNRVFIRFRDESGTVRGATSLSIRS